LDNDSEEKEARCEKDEDFCLGFVTYCTFLNENKQLKNYNKEFGNQLLSFYLISTIIYRFLG